MGESEEAEGAFRRFRARPLGVHEPIPVYCTTPQLRKRNAELYRWLSSAEGQRRDQVQVVDKDGRVIQPEPWLDGAEGRLARRERRIEVPTWEYATHEREEKRVRKSESPFRRRREMRLDAARYIVDDEDVEWLKRTEVPLNFLAFESIFTTLEKRHFESVRSKKVASLQNGKVCLGVPCEQEALPLGEALEAVGTSAEAEVTEKVYNYWIEKRQARQKPLLHELWTAFPWSVILDRSMRSDALGDPRRQRKDDRVETTPFEGTLSTVQIPSSKLPLDQQLQRLRSIRQDLEIARTLADQVRRREKLKKKRDDLFLEGMQRQMYDMVSSRSQSLIDSWTAPEHNNDTSTVKGVRFQEGVLQGVDGWSFSSSSEDERSKTATAVKKKGKRKEHGVSNDGRNRPRQKRTSQRRSIRSRDRQR